MAALETVELLAGDGAFLTRTGQGEAAVAGLNVDVVSFDAWNFGGQDVGVGRFVEVNRGLPAGGPGRKTVQALLDREQIPERIPAGKRHVPNRSTHSPVRFRTWSAIYLALSAL